MDRRNFLRTAGMGGLVAAAYVLSGTAQEKTPAEKGSSPAKIPSHSFECTLRVNICGREWYNEFKKNSDPDLKLSPAMIAEAERQFSNGARVAGLSTIDDFNLNFYPRGLVQFDIYEGEGKEPAARNVNSENFRQVVLPRRTGFVRYSFRTRIPDNESRFPQTFTFFDDDEILHIALNDPNYSGGVSTETDTNKPKPDTAESLDEATKSWFFNGGMLIPRQGYNGIYQRVFDLHDKESHVEYSVFGLEELAGNGMAPKDFAKFFQNRASFHNSLAKFKEYQHAKRKLESEKR
jgi:hypothetical protein